MYVHFHAVLTSTRVNGAVHVCTCGRACVTVWLVEDVLFVPGCCVACGAPPPLQQVVPAVYSGDAGEHDAVRRCDVPQ
jgi:hypothetical protein